MKIRFSPKNATGAFITPPFPDVSTLTETVVVESLVITSPLILFIAAIITASVTGTVVVKSVNYIVYPLSKL